MTDEKQRRQLFDQILSEYSSLVAKVCYMYGTDDDHRKDLYQECMANVWMGLRNFRGEARLSTWLYRACINTCISSYRRNKNGMTVPIESVTAPIAADESDRPSALKEMYRLISRLSPVDRALIMMWLDEKSYDEISEVTGMPRNTVASKLRRIKSHLVSLANE